MSICKIHSYKPFIKAENNKYIILPANEVDIVHYNKELVDNSLQNIILALKTIKENLLILDENAPIIYNELKSGDNTWYPVANLISDYADISISNLEQYKEILSHSNDRIPEKNEIIRLSNLGYIRSSYDYNKYEIILEDNKEYTITDEVLFLPNNKFLHRKCITKWKPTFFTSRISESIIYEDLPITEELIAAVKNTRETRD